MAQLDDLRKAAINRHRSRLFGESSLKVYSTSPADGDAEEAEFTEDWTGQRVWATTDMGVKGNTGAWQFQIVATADWWSSQDFMTAIVALTVGSVRWKVTKVEEPVGRSLVWKVKAQKQ